jgi:hypothetical protein
VIPVARKVWQLVEEGSPASCALRFIIRSTSVRVIAFAASYRCLSMLRKSGDFFSSLMPAASRYASKRKAGELLKEMKQNGQRHNGCGGDQKSVSQATTPKLTDLGITRDQSSKWQKLSRC